MSRSHSQIAKQTSKFLLMAVLFMFTFIPTSGFSAERDGTTIFFSFNDLRQELAQPSLSRLAPIFSWQSQKESDARMTPIERNILWGNGLGIDGYAYPGSRRPLWGY